MTTGIDAVLLIHLIRMRLAGRLSHTAWVSEFLSDISEMRVLQPEKGTHPKVFYIRDY